MVPRVAGLSLGSGLPQEELEEAGPLPQASSIAGGILYPSKYPKEGKLGKKRRLQAALSSPGDGKRLWRSVAASRTVRHEVTSPRLCVLSPGTAEDGDPATCSGGALASRRRSFS